MSLTPAEFVQWKDGEACHTGRVMRDTELRMSVGAPFAPHGVLVRHSFTHDLEFVAWDRLERMPEEHAE